MASTLEEDTETHPRAQTATGLLQLGAAQTHPGLTLETGGHGACPLPADVLSEPRRLPRPQARTSHQVGSNSLHHEERVVEPGDASSQTSGTVEISESKMKKTQRKPPENERLTTDRGREGGRNSRCLGDMEGHTGAPQSPVCSHPYDILEKTELQGQETSWFPEVGEG